MPDAVSVLKGLADTVKEKSRGTIKRFEIIEKKEDLVASTLEFIELVKGSLPDKPIIGMIEKEPQKGKYADALKSAMSEKLGNATIVDASDTISDILSIRRPQDIPIFEKCSKFVIAAFKEFVSRIQEAANKDEKVKQSNISDEMNKQIDKQLPRLCREFELESDFVYGVAAPLVQSGGNYTFKTSSLSSEADLSYDNVVLTFTGSYFDFKVSATRTLIFSPSSSDEDDYKLM